MFSAKKNIWFQPCEVQDPGTPLRTDPARQMQKRLTVYIQNWDPDPSTATWISILIIEGIDIFEEHTVLSLP